MNSRMVRQEMLPSGLVGTKANNGFGRLEVELLSVITKSSFSSMELEVDCRGKVVGHLGTWIFIQKGVSAGAVSKMETRGEFR